MTIRGRLTRLEAKAGARQKKTIAVTREDWSVFWVVVSPIYRHGHLLDPEEFYALERENPGSTTLIEAEYYGPSPYENRPDLSVEDYR